MRFGRVHDGLDQMSNRSSLAVEDVLDLFYDLCEDVREETGTPVDQLEMRNEDALMRRLPWTGNIFVKTYKANKGRFQSQTRMKILQGVESEVEDAVRRTDEAVSVLEKIRSRGEDLAAQKRELQKTLQETEEGRAACRQIQSEIDSLEKEIDPVLKDRIRELRSYKQDREKEALELHEQISKEKAALEQLAAENGRLKHDRDALRLKAAMQNEKNEKLRDEERRLEESISSMDEASSSLDERIRSLQRDLESRDYDKLRQYKMEKIEALEAQQENCTELEDEIARIQAALEQEQIKFRETTAEAARAQEALRKKLEEHADKRNEFEAKKAEFERQCEAEKEALQRDEAEFADLCRQSREEARKEEEAFEARCSAEKDKLAQEAKDFAVRCEEKRQSQRDERARFEASCSAELEKLGQEEIAFKARCNLDRENIAKQEAAFKQRCAEEVQKIRQEEEAFKARCNAQKERILKQEKEARARSEKEKEAVLRYAEIQKMEAEKRRLDILHTREQAEQEQEELLRQEKQMEEELGKLRSELIEERMEKARARVAVMQEIRGALEDSYEVLLRTSGKRQEDIPETRLFDARLDRVDDELKSCTALYRNLIRSLEGGTL